MKILFIMYSYLPQGSAEINLITKVTKELKAKGVTIDFLTTKSDIYQENISVIDNSKVYRIFYGRNYSVRYSKYSLLEKVKISIDKILDILSFKINNKSFLNKHLVRKIKEAFRKYELLDYDLYIPVSGYYEMYEATKKVLKKYNKDIILYQLDPITNNTGYSSDTDNHRKKFEFLLASECSGIIATEYLIDQKKELGLNIGNCYSLEFPNIDKKFNVCNLENSKLDNPKVALFGGNLSLSIRNPRYTLELFSKLDANIKLQIAGSGCNEIIDEYVNTYPNKFEYLGFLNAEEIKMKIIEADFLVNIGNNNINFVPSKIFEYISTGKPIINTCKDENCPTIQYLTDYFDNSISLIESDNINDSLIFKVNQFINNNYNVHISYEDIERVYKKYTAEYVADELYKIFFKKIEGEKR